MTTRSSRPPSARSARRVAPLIERINDPEIKASAAAELGQYRIQAKDIEGAKVALARAADLALALAPSKRGDLMRFDLLEMIASSQEELGERQASTATLARAGKAALETKDKYWRSEALEMILAVQRKQDDRDAIAETVRRLTAIVKETRESPLMPRLASLLEIQAKAGDVRGALKVLLEAPTPIDELDDRPAEERRDEFRSRILTSLLFACRAGDEEVLSQIAKVIRGMTHAESRNKCAPLAGVGSGSAEAIRRGFSKPGEH